MATLIPAKPLPGNGVRKLSPQETLQRAKALACIQDKDKTKCQGQVFVSLFFDGTGNNRDWVETGTSTNQKQRNCHSNVARLFDFHLNEPNDGFFRFYMPGLGTPFKEIGDAGGMRGDGAGYMGADRINWGILQIWNAAHRYIADDEVLIPVDQIKGICNRISSTIAAVGFEGAYRRLVLDTWRSKLEAAFKKSQRKITQINVAIYGFSRGAAQARACAHWLHEVMKATGGGFELAGVPIRVYFMGLFDSVAAVGSSNSIPGGDGHMAWADDTQIIHPAVEQCVHFVALHEQRAGFPLEAGGDRYTVGYPGMHSDVGGGYEPGEQGRCASALGPSPHLSQIPLVDMHYQSLKGGVPLLSAEEILAKPDLAQFYRVVPKTLSAYHQWQTDCGLPLGGSLEAITKRHAEQLIHWRVLRGKKESSYRAQPFYAESSAKDRRNLWEAAEELAQQVQGLRDRHAAHQAYLKKFKAAVASGGSVYDIGKDGSLEVQHKPLSPNETAWLNFVESAKAIPAASVGLFDNFVHDSRAGFRIKGFHEPVALMNGYLRYRHIFRA